MPAIYSSPDRRAPEREHEKTERIFALRPRINDSDLLHSFYDGVVREMF